jgi:hypothetical protein
MAVEREQVDNPFAAGSCSVPRVMRGENGQWSVEFRLDFYIRLNDGREIRVSDRHVLVRATEQRGRKPRVEHICGTPTASCDTDCSAPETCECHKFHKEGHSTGCPVGDREAAFALDDTKPHVDCDCSKCRPWTT